MMLLATCRPTVGMDYVRSCLDISTAQCDELVDEGLLFPCWNVSAMIVPKKRELRVLAAGLAFYQTFRRALPANPDEIAEYLFPPDEICDSALFQRVLNIDHELLPRLVKAKLVSLLPGEKFTPGRYSPAPKLSRPTVLAFLKSRLAI